MKKRPCKPSQATPASQGEKTSCPRLGRATPARRERSRRCRERRLFTLGSLAFLPLAISVLGYLQSRPNTAAVGLEGEFDASRAFADLMHLASFGPRPPGSRALEQSREFIVGQLRSAGATVVRDSFTASTPVGPIPMCNLVVKIPGASSSIVIIAGHYDTKRMEMRFVGANDGVSSAAFLLEMALVLARRENPFRYWLVFFDGEEAVQRWSATDGLYGSRHFVQELSAHGVLNQIRAVIVVDMVADAHLEIHREAHSTPRLTDIVFAQAQRLGYSRYFLNSPRTIEDDHLPFLALGVPAVDIIDLDYGPFNLDWHTKYDTVDKCSPASLAIVARVVLTTLAALETNLPSQPRGASP